MSTIYDIAKMAGVSPMTVSRVINSSGYISAPTKEKVEKAIKKLEYIPNSAARSLISKETKLLSLLIADITNPFFTRVARGAEDKANELGFQILLGNSDENLTKESNYIDKLLSTRVDGILLAPTGDESKRNIEKLIKRDIPFVMLDRKVAGIESDIVLGDNHKGTRLLIEHLIKEGHRNIALINGPSTTYTARERQKAFKETLKLANIEVNKDLIKEIKFNQNDDKSAVHSLISLPIEQRPTAIFAANNIIAENTIIALKHFGFDVPKDMSIVCFENSNPNRDPYFTTASQPAYSFGSLGIQFLVERIKGVAPTEYREIILPPEINIRSSTFPVR